MKIEIYHHCGYRYKWNFESYYEDEVGDGFVIAASHIEKGKVLELEEPERIISIFDPQFFLPTNQVRKLSTYDFFPDKISNGYITSTFSDGFNEECAKRCVKFQIDSGFKKIIIPTKYYSGMPTTFIQQQSEHFVTPFIKEVNKYKNHNPVLLQLVLNENMIKSDDYSADILNWVTGIKGISGVYLISEINHRQKQISDIEFLYSYLKFISALRLNDLYVLLGFQNTESLILSIAGPDAITIGSYENLRMFNIQNFQLGLPYTRRSPNPRIYVPKLLQWIETNYVGAIRRKIGDDLFEDNRYRALFFDPTHHWHFQKPELYKHYFLAFSRQMNAIANYDGEERYQVIKKMISDSIDNFKLIRQNGIILGAENDGSHLSPWLTSANLFASDQGWDL